MTAWGFTALAACPSVSAQVASFLLLNCVAGAGETSGPQAAQLTQPSAPPFSPVTDARALHGVRGGDDVFPARCRCLDGPKHLDERSVAAVAYSTFPGAQNVSSPTSGSRGEMLCVASHFLDRRNVCSLPSVTGKIASSDSAPWLADFADALSHSRPAAQPPQSLLLWRGRPLPPLPPS
ncbi:hypothetical protein CGLO_04981 [Colletotrichum gloeosporioides Cg-14]|uniref:Uncharacterized protein n=1 Tax=Colletotrichum gloeosporioides (strain Cg-14) TaxID=1237896 RepID=T0KSP9_COLGC|nr:hypothetical protein CGLO_04981 [Colletotrichum gloeosporioides Cg-14]